MAKTRLLGLILGQSLLASAFAANHSIEEVVVDHRGYTYLLSGKFEHKSMVFAFDDHGRLDVGFGEGGVFRLESNQAIRSIDVSQENIAVAASGSLVLLDKSGIVKEEVSGPLDQGRLVRFNSDQSLFLGTYDSRLFKLTPEFELDPSFGVNGELRLKGNKFGLSWVNELSDGRYFIVGVVEREGLAIGCLNIVGVPCSGQDSYYEANRYEVPGFGGFVLVEGGGGRLFAVGVSEDQRQLKRLELDGDLGVVAEDLPIRFREPGYFSQSNFVQAAQGNYLLAWYYLSREFFVYKLNSHGEIETSFGRSGAGDLNHPGYYFYGWAKMQPTLGGKVVFAAQCGENQEPHREGLCLVRLGVDGFLDKSFGVDGVAMIKGI